MEIGSIGRQLDRFNQLNRFTRLDRFNQLNRLDQVDHSLRTAPRSGAAGSLRRSVRNQIAFVRVSSHAFASPDTCGAMRARTVS